MRRNNNKDQFREKVSIKRAKESGNQDKSMVFAID